MTDKEPTLFERRLAEKRAADALIEKAMKTASAPVDDDLIPDAEYQVTEADKELDRVIANIDVLDAYRKWCGKMTPHVASGQRESIMISCPKPSHADKEPSAWINLDKQTWFCGGCQEGGDALDIAAYHFGFDVPGYKTGKSFKDLRMKMASDYGFTIQRFPGGETIITPPVEEDEPPAQPKKKERKLKLAEDVPHVHGDEPDVPEDEHFADEEVTDNVEELFDEGDREIIMPSLDWEKVVTKGTFLDSYMQACRADDVPEEYHLFHGLLAIGFALGRDVRLHDFVPVYPNLFVCTLGRSGTGKSKARYHLDRLLNEVLPHDWTDPGSKGVRKISSPGSAEVLIHNFQKPVEDPTDPKKIVGYAPVRGMIDFNELASLTARANRQGSALAPTMMQFYDMEPVVATSSMTHGSKEAHSPFASALTTSQPKSLRRLVTSADDASGFLNRWVFVPGTEKKRYAIGGVAVDISPCIKPLEDIIGYAASFGPDDYVQWGGEAAEKFTEFFHDRIEPDKRNAPHDMFTRVDLLMKKLVLLFAANEHQVVVRESHVDSAIGMYQYLIDSYAVPAGQIGGSLTNEIAEAVLYQVDKIQGKTGRGVTPGDIMRRIRHRGYPLDMIRKTLETLCQLEYLESRRTTSTGPGRPTVRYYRAE